MGHPGSSVDCRELLKFRKKTKPLAQRPARFKVRETIYRFETEKSDKQFSNRFVDALAFAVLLSQVARLMNQ